ncbi:MAG: acyl-ACP--UDP-N-acetylglucosamine O-acyltransferase [Thermoanaerobaculia bacterium]|nr:acyl-ACP--UDP-N-acetylglucosamine O-acyltransferase [Thermoanaerobaculia bacterium]
MTTRIDSTASIDPSAELGERVEVGRHAVVGAGVVVGDDCFIGAAAHIEGPTVLGRGNRIYPKAAVGFDPQDLKWSGETVRLEVGEENVFREFSTVHRGTPAGGGVTTIGSENLFMVYTHVAHDCHVGSRTIFANNATLAGHVTVEDGATIGAFSAVHQFCRIGYEAYIGGFTILTKDALPYLKTVGQKPACYGVNRIGLTRRGFSDERVGRLEAAARTLLRTGRNTTQALERLREEWPDDPDVARLIDFIVGSERGVIRTLPGSGRKRGG